MENFISVVDEQGQWRQKISRSIASDRFLQDTIQENCE